MRKLNVNVRVCFTIQMLNSMLEDVKVHVDQSLQLDAGYSQSVTSVIHSFLEQWRLSNCDSFHMLYMFSGLACAWDIWIAVLVSRKCMFNKVTILSHIHACMVLVWHIFAGRVLSYGTIFLLPDIFLSKKYVFATDFIITRQSSFNLACFWQTEPLRTLHKE